MTAPKFRELYNYFARPEGRTDNPKTRKEIQSIRRKRKLWKWKRRFRN